MTNEDSFDVAIIGAGITGLVAANYLAKDGLRVLLLEQHTALGGCCSYFSRRGFTFDCGAHSLGSFRPGGQFTRVFKDLGLTNSFSINKAPISDTVIMKNFEANFSGEKFQFVEELSKHFPSERKALDAFFSEVDRFESSHAMTFARYHTKYENSSFQDVLNHFFEDESLKKILCVFLGNIGLPSHLVAALPAITMFKEFVFDGGYYFIGGMKKLSDILSVNFKKMGGVVSINKKVTKICLKNRTVIGVEITGDKFISAKYVISTASTRQTFTQLLDTKDLPGSLLKKVSSFKPSVSCVIAFLGLKGAPIHTQNWGRTVWYVPNWNADEIYTKLYNNGLDENAEALVMTFPSHFDPSLAPSGCSTMNVLIGASFQTADFWKRRKQFFFESMLSRIGSLLPELKDRIIVSEVGSPSTMRRYTLNDEGAMYGLSATIAQSRYDLMPSQTYFDGLYLAGQWTTLSAGQSGTPAAAYAGQRVAKIILKDFSKKKSATFNYELGKGA